MDAAIFQSVLMDHCEEPLVFVLIDREAQSMMIRQDTGENIERRVRKRL